MADFSKTTVFVVPPSNTLPVSGSTDGLTAGKFGVFLNTNAIADVGNIAAAPYFYLAQGRENKYMLGSKKSDKIKGGRNVTAWYKVTGCPTPINQIVDIDDWTVQCGDSVTVSIRAHSSYIDTLFFNGLTRSVTVQAPCCECGADPCIEVDAETLVDSIIAAFEALELSTLDPANSSITKFFTFTRVGSGSSSTLRIEGKPLTAYGQPCDIAAFPHEYDRLWFDAFAFSGPATTADFIVPDACNVIATVEKIQDSSYATGTSAEIKQLEINHYSLQAGYLKHLHRVDGYNPNFESYVADGTTYDTYYIRFNEYDLAAYQWGDYNQIDSMVILAIPVGESSTIETMLEAALGAVDSDVTCSTTTTTTTTGE